MIGAIGFLILIIGAGAADGNLGIAAVMILTGCMMCLYASKKESSAEPTKVPAPQTQIHVVIILHQKKNDGNKKIEMR